MRRRQRRSSRLRNIADIRVGKRIRPRNNALRSGRESRLHAIGLIRLSRLPIIDMAELKILTVMVLMAARVSVCGF